VKIPCRAGASRVSG